MSNFFESTIRNIAKKAEEANVAQLGDYVGEGGLLYCGKCNTPKQCRIDIPSPRVVFCMCECRADEYNRTQNETKLRRNIDNALAEAFDNAELLKWNIFTHDDGLTPQLSEGIRKYCDNFDLFYEDARGLLLWSENSGSGKSYCAASVVNELCKRGINCRMTTFGRIFSDLQSGYNRTDYIQRLIKYDLLVLDDLSAERSSEWANENIFNIVDGRYRAKKPTIFTTNLSIEDIKNPRTTNSQRIFDRILEMCHPIHVECISRRKRWAASEYTKTKEILGI